MDHASLIQIESVTKYYGPPHKGVLALNNVSLDVRAGEFLSIIGPSGCGKSTLLRLIADLLPPSQGFISIDGRTRSLLRVRAAARPASPTACTATTRPPRCPDPRIQARRCSTGGSWLRESPHRNSPLYKPVESRIQRISGKIVRSRAGSRCRRSRARVRAPAWRCRGDAKPARK